MNDSSQRSDASRSEAPKPNGASPSREQRPRRTPALAWLLVMGFLGALFYEVARSGSIGPWGAFGVGLLAAAILGVGIDTTVNSKTGAEDEASLFRSLMNALIKRLGG